VRVESFASNASTVMLWSAFEKPKRGMEGNEGKNCGGGQTRWEKRFVKGRRRFGENRFTES